QTDQQKDMMLNSIDIYVNESCRPNRLDDLRVIPRGTGAEDSQHNMHYILECLKAGSLKSGRFKTRIVDSTKYAAVPDPKLLLMLYTGVFDGHAVFYLAP